MRDHIFVVYFVFLLISVTQAWLMRKYVSRSASPWNSDCSKPGESCLYSNQCCGEGDICLIQRQELLMKHSSLGSCHDIRQQTDNSVFVGQQKDEGELCDSSTECADLCCRVVPRHRNSPIHICGSKDGFMCI